MIIDADRTDTPRLAVLIGRAFHPLAVARWLIPDELQRGRAFPDYFQILVEHAIEHGIVHTTEDRDAVAVWLPYLQGPPPAPRDYPRRLATVAGAWLDRFTIFDAVLDEHHPHRPHHYLAFLAVRPDRQGRGLGTLLLNHHHTHLDQSGIPAYLEASSRTSRALYLRQGYTPHGHPLVLPNGPLLWPLLREPGNPADPGWLVQGRAGSVHTASWPANRGGGSHDHTPHSAPTGRGGARRRPADRLPPDPGVRRR